MESRGLASALTPFLFIVSDAYLMPGIAVTPMNLTLTINRGSRSVFSQSGPQSSPSLMFVGPRVGR
jgi:hypothetical protein